MKLVIQRVLSASVEVDDEVVSKIGCGLLILVGLAEGDDYSDIDYMINKTINMRIFPDDQGKMNVNVCDIGGEILLVSQFTLYGDCSKGNRPSFIKAMKPDKARIFYKKFIDRFKELYGLKKVFDGIFGADMKVSLVNDGPVTIILD